MDSASGWKKKRSKKYYMHPSKRRKRSFVLEPDLKGFVVTCNNRERDCIREAYNLLNEFADKLYGSEVKEDDNQSGDDELSVEAALEKEVNSLKAISERRFQVVESGAKNCLFIKTQVEDPCRLVYAILEDIEQNKVQRTKYLLRMLPVSKTCRAYIDDIKKTVDELVTGYFASTTEAPPSYAITYKIRNNNRLKREDLLPPLVELIQSKCLAANADLKNPDIVINAEIICNMCCVSILKDYYKFSRYNLVEFAAKVNKNSTHGEPEKKNEVPQLEQDAPETTPDDLELKSEITDLEQETLEMKVQQSEEKDSCEKVHEDNLDANGEDIPKVDANGEDIPKVDTNAVEEEKKVVIKDADLEKVEKLKEDELVEN